ncbi:MAG: transcriptional repressor [Candidatus Cloacimonadota bacterium]|nr:MAG: transcriptional repressor [Candidatus Cloacimonadota bacterium]
MNSLENIRKIISEKGLKATPQRVIILETIYSLANHPSADNIIEEINKKYPGIAVGTVYKVLDTFVRNNLIKKVKTDKDIMRYDGRVENHHHLYCEESDLIADYHDEELDKILEAYFKKKKIEGYVINDIMLQIKVTKNKQ